MPEWVPGLVMAALLILVGFVVAPALLDKIQNEGAGELLTRLALAAVAGLAGHFIVVLIRKR